MRRPIRPKATGLKKGAIETHVDTLIEIQFGCFKDEMNVDDALFSALKILCTTDNVFEAIKQAENALSEGQWTNYKCLSDFFLDPQNGFRLLGITKSDVPEVRYAMQRRLYFLIKEFIEKKQEQTQSGWLQISKRTLQERYNSLPTQHRVQPNYSLAAQYGAHILLASAFVVTLVLVVGAVLFCSPKPEKMVSIPAILMFLLLALVVKFMVLPEIRDDTGRARGLFVGLEESLNTESIMREIYAKPPSEDKSENKNEDQVAESGTQFAAS